MLIVFQKCRNLFKAEIRALDLTSPKTAPEASHAIQYCEGPPLGGRLANGGGQKVRQPANQRRSRGDGAPANERPPGRLEARYYWEFSECNKIAGEEAGCPPPLPPPLELLPPSFLPGKGIFSRRPFSRDFLLLKGGSHKGE